jgi:hypothetical protein
MVEAFNWTFIYLGIAVGSITLAAILVGIFYKED